ncbi:MAG TPA: outer membrane protein assembly factor BamD [Flavobacteriales bacterium]
MRTHHLLLFLCALMLTACSEFNKAVKSEDKAYKMEMAVKYFNKEDYDRAMPLLEELRQLTRGDTMYERVSYYYAKGYFGMKDYILGGYYLDNFAKTFRASRYAEECSFLAAICHYKESPEYELDQVDTRTAISQLELFMVRYPETALKDSCNNLIDQLRAKLEVKEYKAAKQYLHTRNYRAASVALQSFMKHWPNSEFREDVLFSILQADHDLAVNSVESSQAKRIEDGIRSYGTFADAFPESSRLNDAKRLLADLTERQNRSTSKETP